MKKVEYFCDKCEEGINEEITPIGGERVAGSGALCTLKYEGIIGHNKFINDKHYHYYCFSTDIIRLL